MRRILIIDDERDTTEFLVKFVTEEGLSVQTATDLESAIHRARAWKPHLLLLSGALRSEPALELIPRLKNAVSHGGDDCGPVIYFSDPLDLAGLGKVFDAGADDYLAKPLTAEDILCRFRAMLRYKESQDSLRRATHRIEEMGVTDELTGLLNFRAIFRKGEDEVARCRSFRKPVSAVLLNLDAFTRLNQKSGFEVGNFALQEAAHRIRKALRTIDLAARIGADEFFILLGESDLAGAERVATQVQEAIASKEFHTEKQGVAPFSVSACAGVAGYSADQSDQTLAGLMNIAQEALRSAKAAGPGSLEIYSFS